MDKKLKVAIAAGGTAGHINPALALAEELKQRGHDPFFVGQKTRLEAQLVPAAGFAFFPIKVSGFDRSRPWTAALALWRMRTAQHTIENIAQKEGMPDVAIGFGAYIEVPLLRWCKAHKINYLLHEQNSVPGLANKLMAKNAKLICLSFPAAESAFSSHKGRDTRIITTGNPVRKSVIAATREEGRAAFGIPEKAEVLLVFGGSLGARHLNEAIARLKSELLDRRSLYILHSSGQNEFQSVQELLDLNKEQQKRWKLMPYIQNMGEALAAADLIVSRAGASSIAEIAARALPSLLIPYPYATENHQMTNACLLADKGAAVICTDESLKTEFFAQKLFQLIDDRSVRDKMQHSAALLAAKNAAATLADKVEELAFSTQKQ